MWHKPTQLLKSNSTMHSSTFYRRDLITYILEKGGSLKSKTTTKFAICFSWCLSLCKSVQLCLFGWNDTDLHRLLDCCANVLLKYLKKNNVKNKDRGRFLDLQQKMSQEICTYVSYRNAQVFYCLTDPKKRLKFQFRKCCNDILKYLCNRIKLHAFISL